MEESKGMPPVIHAPVTGEAIPLETVGDEAFSRGLLGDGIAIVPREGKILAPFDGRISVAMEWGYAYCFADGKGLEVLVHVGQDSLTLKGEGFRSHVKPGDPVKQGDLVAEVDLKLLEERGISAITPVVICQGGENSSLWKARGQVEAGKSPILILKGNEE